MTEVEELAITQEFFVETSGNGLDRGAQALPPPAQSIARPLMIGRVYRHPEQGRLLRIISRSDDGFFGLSGDFWFWEWLDEDSRRLTGHPKGRGPGWDSEPLGNLYKRRTECTRGKVNT